MNKLRFLPRALADLFSVWQAPLAWKEKSSLTRTFAHLKWKHWVSRGATVVFPLGGLRLRGPNQGWLQHLIREIFVDKVYLPGRLLKPPARIIDGGSNIGLSVIFFARAFPDARIEAFEPEERTFRLLRKNLRRAHLMQVTARQAAPGEVEGPLWREEGFEPFSINQRFTAERGPGQPVPVVRLTNLLACPADIVKLDLEGGEVPLMEEVIRQGLLKQAGCWLIEWHGAGEERQGMINAFKEEGFACRHRKGVYCFTQTPND